MEDAIARRAKSLPPSVFVIVFFIIPPFLAPGMTIELLPYVACVTALFLAATGWEIYSTYRAARGQHLRSIGFATVTWMGMVINCTWGFGTFYVRERAVPREMQTVLRNLLDELESISERHAVHFDNEVRKRVGKAVLDGFVRYREKYAVPDDFGMPSAPANVEVKAALQAYMAAANATAMKGRGLAYFHERLAAAQDPHVRTSRGNGYTEYLGHTPPELYNRRGELITITDGCRSPDIDGRKRELIQ